MDRFGEWRPIEAAAVDDGDKPSPTNVPAKPIEPARPEANAISVRLIGLLAAAVLGVTGAAVWLTSTSAQPNLQLSGGAVYFDVQPSGSAAPLPPSTALGEIVIDVQGAVVRPGLHRLPSGSRVGDAIAVAGGYSPQVDIDAAARSLNLAELLADGVKIHVPARGEQVAAAGSGPPQAPSAVDPGGAGGLINLNTAATEELDTLPGIGPVTAAKIIAAREATPFASVDDLLAREVVGSSTFEKIRALVTVSP